LTGADIYVSRRFVLLYSDVAYIVAVAGFWWWLGTLIDNRRLAFSKSAVSQGYWLLGALSFVVFVICLIEIARNEFIIGRALPIFGAIWSVLLLALALCTAARQPARLM